MKTETQRPVSSLYIHTNPHKTLKNDDKGSCGQKLSKSQKKKKKKKKKKIIIIMQK